jgi:Phosphoribosylamine-glycine ligase
LTKKGIKVIEFNARFGDPETEVVLPRLQSDLSEIIEQILCHKSIKKIDWETNGINLGVFAVSKGYPVKPVFGSLGDRDSFKKCPLMINYAAVKRDQQKLFSHGGRLYLMQAQDESVEDAQVKVYRELEKMDQTNIFIDVILVRIPFNTEKIEVKFHLKYYFYLFVFYAFSPS